MRYAGIDVSKKELEVAFEPSPGDIRSLTIPNTSKGHKTLIKLLTKRKGRVRVAMEPTGLYGLDLALALDAHPRMEVMSVNPRAARNFAKAANARGKDDRIDACVLLEFVKRMDFQPWARPSGKLLELRVLTRRCIRLSRDVTVEKNRRAAVKATKTTPAIVLEDIEESISTLERRIERLESAALDLVQGEPGLQEKLELLVSVKGIANRTAVRLLPELLLLPKDMDVRRGSPTPAWTPSRGNRAHP